MPAKKTTNKKNSTYLKKKRSNIKNYRKKKQVFNNKRRPFTEIKSRSQLDLYKSLGGTAGGSPIDNVRDPTVLLATTNTIAATNVMWSYVNPVQGVTNQDMVGQTLNMKYLTAKIVFKFPATPQIRNPRYYIIHGWMTNSIDLTAHTTPTKSAFTRQNLIDYVNANVTEYYNELNRQEFLDFREASQKNFKIEGFQRIKPDLRHNQVLPQMYLTASSVDPAVFGQNTPKNITLKWKCNNRKIKYTQGAHPSASAEPFFYPNDSQWIPFWTYYNPDADKVADVMDADNFPQYASDNKVWFSDS